MSAFLNSVLGIALLSAAMIAGLGQSNDAQARPWGGYGGGYRAGYGGVYYGQRYNNGYRYNAYRPNYGYGYSNYYGRGYGYNNYYGPRNYVGVGGVQFGW